MNGIMIHIRTTVKHSVKDSLIQCTCTYMCLHKQRYLRVPSRLPFCQVVAASQVTECNSTCLLPILPCDLIAMSSVLAIFPGVPASHTWSLFMVVPKLIS